MYDLNHRKDILSPVPLSPFSFLEQLPEFQSLPKSDLNYLMSKCTVRELSNGQVIFQEGESSDFVYFVVDGKISMGNCTQSGRETTMCIAGRKDFFCCLPALDFKPYPVAAQSIGPSTVIKLPLSIFQEICRKHPLIYQKFVTKTCEILRGVAHRHNNRTESAFSKIASLLVNLHSKSTHPIRLTRAEVAKLVGVTVETAIRSLSEMDKQKVIQSKRGVIKIIDKEKLFELSESSLPKQMP